MRILSVVGARPQFVKLAPIAHACAAAGVDHVIVHTGQHYDPMLSDVFFADLAIPAPDHHLNVGSLGHGAQTGRMMERLEPVLVEENPDWVLVYGDTNSTLAAAVDAVKLHLPLAHLEAGLRSFNRRMPEEHNRVATDHLADLLLAPTDVAAAHLADEGLGERTVVVGDVMTDVVMTTKAAVADKPNPLEAELGLKAGQYRLATIHRPDNTDDPARLDAILDDLSCLDLPTVILAHPRLIAACERAGISLDRGTLISHRPLAYPDLVAAAVASAGVVTDSGGLQKEAFLLRVPTTTVRPETEWVETVSLGWNVLVEPGDALRAAAQRPAPEPTSASPYGDGHAAEAVVEALLTRR
ncbi:UDP-N-acetylglucosamine 2-epimerase (non-hydrolyzing) [Nanchangia anserum]|uniref:UDP-N-acetylglucosamine 2-epimerase (Non-hydrolyzing) n=1 Tax=Nanchangia anserum TaxID=2692125 RepID=A0A8I0KQL3_9ACTO|nr:UDP-N-acetylglucosamine 2-epimerase (non-hydrolyzing) [Nanchangia anserum]MBD3690110.1 UDP-N-acetylglucosamine 2-epimerase (non-hydrolyzing) [Nanchangia anserum]QOX82104.1 UDP-N-acetylglucosamine 2-epimerase (non-hydrolyzing) [Nanchangia anserum]